MSYVLYKGEKYFIEEGILRINDFRINDIDEIEGLRNLTELIVLDLNNNEITEIKGFEGLKKLRTLDYV